MNIGIDIDDTINNLHIVLSKYGTKFNKEENIKYDIRLDEWDFDKAFGWDEYHIEKFLTKYIEKSYNQVIPKENAAQIINRLKEEGHNIIIITARSKKHCRDPYEISKKWLDKYNIRYDKIIVEGFDKAEKCIDNDIDIFIDDNIENCNRVSERTNASIFIFDSPYNKKDNKHKRVFSWEELYTEIKCS